MSPCFQTQFETMQLETAKSHIGSQEVLMQIKTGSSYYLDEILELRVTRYDTDRAELVESITDLPGILSLPSKTLLAHPKQLVWGRLHLSAVILSARIGLENNNSVMQALEIGQGKTSEIFMSTSESLIV